jgi:hypothetical protein
MIDNELVDLIIDKYTPPELIEKFDITTEEFIDYIWPLIRDNPEVFDEDFEVDGELYD